MEAEKYYLGERIFELTGVEEGFWSDEILVIKKKTFISGFGGDDPDRGENPSILVEWNELIFIFDRIKNGDDVWILYREIDTLWDF